LANFYKIKKKIKKKKPPGPPPGARTPRTPFASAIPTRPLTHQ
jgi:hypothetical protein